MNENTSENKKPEKDSSIYEYVQQKVEEDGRIWAYDKQIGLSGII